MLNVWVYKKRIFLCGNGGRADLREVGLDVESLPANSSVLTSSGNDVGYKNVFCKQLLVKALSDDLLIVLSGSGNSDNIVEAIKIAKFF